MVNKSSVCFSTRYNYLLLPFSIRTCYDMEVGENRMRVFYGTEKREGERLEIYTGVISPCSSDRVSDL